MTQIFAENLQNKTIGFLQKSILYAKGRSPFSYAYAAIATKACFLEARRLFAKGVLPKTIGALLFLCAALTAEELRVKAAKFQADEKKGISVFEGDVNIVKGLDELNATKVSIYVNEERKPVKFVAEKDVSFRIQTQEGSLYEGRAQKVIYLPIEKEYHFFTQVYLRQLNEKKEIMGDEVVLKAIEGKAHAKGGKEEPVIMIFDLKEIEEKN